MTPEAETSVLEGLRLEKIKRDAREAHSTPGISPITGERVSDQHGLLAFIRYFWDVLEPETPFVEGWVLDAITQHLEAVTLGLLTRLMVNVSPGSMKACDCDTPVLTTVGWKRHGDLAIGDFVFGPDGVPKKVLGRTKNNEEDCYEVVFDDGAMAVVSGGHLWAIERDFPNQNDGKRGRWKRLSQVVTTRELKEGKVGSSRRCADRIAVTQPVACQEKVFSIDPYLLGVWLGDGASSQGIIYSGNEDLAHFAKLGRIVKGTGTCNRIQVECLTTRLRVLGLLRNKHIPQEYLEGSIEQRWALLQGLMDTDGQVSPEGWCRFTTAKKHLADQFISLASSLGLKPRLGNPVYGINKEKEKLGPYYRVRFTAPQGSCIFRLRRKQSRLQGGHRRAINHRFVVSVKPVKKRLVNCIHVEGALYLVTKHFIPTHNSLTTNVFFPAWEWGPMGMPHLRYVSFAYSAGLTERDNVKFRKLVQSDKYRELYGDVFVLEKEGEVKITNNRTGSKFASSVSGIGLGERGDRIILDDPHDVQHSESDTVRNATLRWFRETVSDRLNNTETSAIVIIMQRVHQSDICGLILDLQWDYCHLMIPMEYEAGRDEAVLAAAQANGFRNTLGWLDPRTEDGELAWPERFSPRAVERIRIEKARFAFAAQYQQRPAPRTGGIIEFGWWQPYNPENALARFGYVWPQYPPMSYTILSVDTAQTEKKQNDPSAAVLLGVCQDINERNQIILMWAWSERLEFFELCNKIEQTCKDYRVHRVIIEDKASGLPLSQELRRRGQVFSDRLSHNPKTRDRADFGVQTVTPEGDKIARMYAVQNLFEAGVVWAPADVNGNFKNWADKVMTEVAELPAGKNDDLADAISQGLSFLRKLGLALMPDDDAYGLDDEMLYKRRSEKPLYPTFSAGGMNGRA